MTNPLRCSSYAREVGLNPAGSAGSYDGFLLVEHPLPWPRDLSEDPMLAALTGPLQETRYRLQGLVPADGAAPTRRVIHYRRPPGLFRAYRRSEHPVSVADLVERCTALLVEDPSLAEPTERDVLVCGHGKRDSCCGSMGVGLLTALAVAPEVVRDGLSLWRTSHTGGHRFAPTAIVFPEATLWAYLDDGSLPGIVDRSLPAADAASHYRGCAGLDGPEVQALDAAVLAQRGWEWLDCARAGRVVEREGATSLVRIDYDGGAYEATVTVGRIVPVPDCGKPIEAAKKAEPEFRVTSLRMLEGL